MLWLLSIHFLNFILIKVKLTNLKTLTKFSDAKYLVKKILIRQDILHNLRNRPVHDVCGNTCVQLFVLVLERQQKAVFLFFDESNSLRYIVHFTNLSEMSCLLSSCCIGSACEELPCSWILFALNWLRCHIYLLYEVMNITILFYFGSELL